MKKIIVTGMVAGFCAGVVSAENFWPNSGMEEGKGSVPSGYVRGGTDQSLLRWGAPAASGEKAIGVVDSSRDGFGNWSSVAVRVPAGLAGRPIRVSWVERFNVESGIMRVSVTFFDEANGLIKPAVANHLVRNKSEGWSAGTFVPVEMKIQVPAEAVTMKISLISAGLGDATGEIWIDDVKAEPADVAVIVG